jgi:hypothetical protein
MKYILQIIAAIIFLFIGWLTKDENLKSEFLGNGFAIIIILLIVELGYDIYKNYGRLKLIIQCWALSLNGEYVRFSMSYQYRIKINDKYLLVKNSNWNLYQHVGGKYKRNSLTTKVLTDFGFKDDLKLSTTGRMKDDLAVFIPAKNAVKFLDWFNSKKEREVSHWREFYEELIGEKAQILDNKIFPYVNYNYITSILTPLKKARKFESMEILQYDILDFVPTPEQEKFLIKLQSNGDTDYIKWADNELINHLGHKLSDRKTDYEIGTHAKWVINEKWSNE